MKKPKELETADRIIGVLRDAMDKNNQFKMHVGKLKTQNPSGTEEEIQERELTALDTKRILEAACALEKAARVKLKLAEDASGVKAPVKRAKRENNTKPNETVGTVSLPPVIYPNDTEA